jgi:multicomponent Na+:H+ antiporter subunit E
MLRAPVKSKSSVTAMHAWILFVSLMAFYVVLSGQIHSVYLLVAGAVCCAAIVLLCKRLGVVDDEGVSYRWWWATLKYVPWLMWQIALANWELFKIVWKPGKLAISPKMVAVPHELRTSYGLATYANSITLTPGTVTVEIGDHELLVHALTDAFGKDLLAGEMHRRCLELERQGSR